MSQVLREAREFAEANPAPSDSGSSSPSSSRSGRLTFLQLWDNGAGPAHLEALALMARQCSGEMREGTAALSARDRQTVEAGNKELKVRNSLKLNALFILSIKNGYCQLGMVIIN